ncbi:hypothetical protein F506_18405 [Herbaspirillum hiltneri N3]|uniref:DUF4123 domain-containing protein n=1 Tax=Herbaspirillum hiltneri N3 TaxID=1262470 RepID=A0ABM5V408_9BURK|nr:DUF4123 domain-containing protein [Herbaspirillum hiltneri]AKZ64368.1 hypothetical protein F506_18405 [Herbaspirillum hiltneri N3]
MFFGVDPHQDNLPELLDAALNAIEQARREQAESPLHTYALIDCAFDDAWGSALLWQQSQAVKTHYVRSLYTASRLEALEECAPFLVIVDHDNRTRMLTNLLARTGGKPMLTFIQSPLDLFALQKHLVRFSQIETPDTLVLPLRFADSVGLPDILEVFDEDQRAALLSGITAWHTIDRRGGMATITGTCHDAGLYATPDYGDIDCIPFSEAQFVALVDSAEADEILAEVVDSTTEMCHDEKISTLFEKIKAALGEMDQRHIKDAEDRRVLTRRSLNARNSNEITAMLDVYQTQGITASMA